MEKLFAKTAIITASDTNGDELFGKEFYALPVVKQ